MWGASIREKTERKHWKPKDVVREIFESFFDKNSDRLKKGIMEAIETK